MIWLVFARNFEESWLKLSIWREKTLKNPNKRKRSCHEQRMGCYFGDKSGAIELRLLFILEPSQFSDFGTRISKLSWLKLSNRSLIVQLVEKSSRMELSENGKPWKNLNKRITCCWMFRCDSVWLCDIWQIAQNEHDPCRFWKFRRTSMLSERSKHNNTTQCDTWIFGRRDLLSFSSFCFPSIRTMWHMIFGKGDSDTSSSHQF